MNQQKVKDIITIMVITLMLSMESIDANILNIAIPTIATKLMISPIHLKHAITSYLIAIAIFIPISGWVADRFGTKRTLLISITLFCLTSFLCGISRDIYTLSMYRFFQGASGAFMIPVARLLLLKAFPKEKLVKIYLFMSIPTIIGPLMSPMIGAYLITNLSWPFIFFVNLPIGALAFTATYFFVGNYKQKSSIFSLTAYFWLAISISSFVFYISLANADDFTLNFKLSLILIFIISTLLYVFFEHRAKTHVVNYSLFKVQTFKSCFFGNVIIRCAFGGRAFVIALFLQIALQIKPQQASYLLACATIGLLVSRLIIRKFLVAYGFKRVLSWCNIGSAISLMLMPTINHINILAIIIFIFNGLFLSMSFILMNLLCYADVTESDHANAVSLNLTAQQISTVAGVLIASYCMQTFNFMFHHNFGHITFTCTFIALALIGLTAEYYFIRLKPTDGNNLIHIKN